MWRQHVALLAAAGHSKDKLMYAMHSVFYDLMRNTPEINSSVWSRGTRPASRRLRANQPRFSRPSHFKQAGLQLSLSLPQTKMYDIGQNWILKRQRPLS